MHFAAFPKIPATTRGKGTPGGLWVALEKIHGAQLVVAVDGQGVRFGKRKSWLAEDENFFGWQLLRPVLEQSARAVYAALGAPVTLYGELFGGAYPHPAVQRIPGLQAVQTGIWYTPDLRWALFDARVGEEFLAWSELKEIAIRSELLTPPLIATGTCAALGQVSHRFPTRVPALFGLPELPDNLAEGVVMKPDAREKVAERSALKRKIPEFDEARFDESEPMDPSQRLSAQELAALARRFVNPARLASARSKVGEGTGVLDEVVLDVMLDLSAAFSAAMATLGPEGEAEIDAAIREAARWV